MHAFDLSLSYFVGFLDFQVSDIRIRVGTVLVGLNFFHFRDQFLNVGVLQIRKSLLDVLVRLLLARGTRRQPHRLCRVLEPIEIEVAWRLGALGLATFGVTVGDFGVLLVVRQVLNDFVFQFFGQWLDKRMGARLLLLSHLLGRRLKDRGAKLPVEVAVRGPSETGIVLRRQLHGVQCVAPVLAPVTKVNMLSLKLYF